MNNTSSINITDRSASAAPLGLFAFGICTLLLNFYNIGWINLDIIVLSMGFFYGGLTQIVVGILEGKKGNLFGLVAFTSYGIFWLTFVAIAVIPKTGLIEEASSNSMLAYLALWTMFTVILFIGTFKLNRALQFVFGTLVVLFLLLTISTATNEAGLGLIAGYIGLVCGCASIYTAVALVINEVYGRNLLPIGQLD